MDYLNNKMVYKNILEKYKKHTIYGWIILIIIFFGIGISIGGYIQKDNFKKFTATFKNIRQENDKYPLIDPLIGISSAPATDVGIFVDLKEEVENYLEDKKKKGELYGYSFYFKDLNSPLWFGVKEEESFAPASLFKIPVALAIYRQGETDPNFFNQRFLYTKEVADINNSAYNNEASSLIIGKSYSVEELVTIMLEMSDNGAKDILINVLDKKYIKELFSIMLLVDPLSVQGYEISARKYALFLRILYNSSYLNEEHSNYILSLLTKSTFKEGIVAGVPSGIEVAHKFGTYNDPTVKASILHDCGIVYVKEDPYVVCIMTKGKDVQSLLKVISDVSKMIYERESEKI